RASHRQRLAFTITTGPRPAAGSRVSSLGGSRKSSNPSSLRTRATSSSHSRARAIRRATPLLGVVEGAILLHFVGPGRTHRPPSSHVARRSSMPVDASSPIEGPASVDQLKDAAHRPGDPALDAWTDQALDLAAEYERSHDLAHLDRAINLFSRVVSAGED